ncbi:MAG: DUF192 domain-containing protein [Paenisporosarcina sp.]
MIYKSKTINLEFRINHAHTFWQRFKGLLFYKKPIVDEGLLITRCNSIHMFFMKFPIDAVFLDQSNTVVKVVSHVKPWSVISPVRSAHSTLELPSGTISERSIGVGDTIILEDCKESTSKIKNA